MQKSREATFLDGYDAGSRGMWDLIRDGQAVGAAFLQNINRMVREQRRFTARISRRTRLFSMFKNWGRINSAHGVLVKAADDIESYAALLDELHLDKYAQVLVVCYTELMGRASQRGGDNRAAAETQRAFRRTLGEAANGALQSTLAFRATVDDLASQNLSSDLNRACRCLKVSLESVTSAITSYREFVTRA
jgi:hypothetical protein